MLCVNSQPQQVTGRGSASPSHKWCQFFNEVGAMYVFSDPPAAFNSGFNSAIVAAAILGYVFPL